MSEHEDEGSAVIPEWMGKWIPYVLLALVGGGNFMWTEQKSGDRFTGEDGRELYAQIKLLEGQVQAFTEHGPVSVNAKLNTVIGLLREYEVGEKGIRKQHTDMEDDIQDMLNMLKRMEHSCRRP